MKNSYNFISQQAFFEIEKHWKNFAEKINAKKWIVAVSGGKDSTIVAALAAKIFGKENVVGVTLPCDGQKDIGDSMRVIDMYCGKHINIDIGDMFYNLLDKMDANAIEPSNDTRINIPPRLRMSVTYAVAQSVGGIVLNTSNLTEDILGYCTLWGDTCGSYAPIQGLTVTEVLALGDYLGIPYELVHKVPADGLQDQTDEDRLGMKYEDVDRVIRLNVGDVYLKAKINDKYTANKFKLDMIRIEGPKFKDFPNFVTDIQESVEKSCQG